MIGEGFLDFEAVGFEGLEPLDFGFNVRAVHISWSVESQEVALCLGFDAEGGVFGVVDEGEVFGLYGEVFEGFEGELAEASNLAEAAAVFEGFHGFQGVPFLRIGCVDLSFVKSVVGFIKRRHIE